MAKVLRPAGTGAQQLGAVQAKGADTPFSNQTLPDLSKGEKRMWEGVKQIGTAVQSGAAIGMDIVVKNDKRTLLQYEADRDALDYSLLKDPETGLESLKGQDRLDRITGTTFGPHSDEASDSLANDYKTKRAAISAKYMGSLSTRGRESMQLSDQIALTTFNGVTSGAEIKAQFQVDTAILENRLGATVTRAVSATGTMAQSTTLDTEKKTIRQTILDKDIGWAKVNGITDPALIADAIKKQQGTMVNAMIVELISQGKVSEANTLFKSEMQPDGALNGTTIGTNLQGKLKTLSDAQIATDTFESLYLKHTKDGVTDWKTIYNKAYETKDATLQTNIIRQIDIRKSIDASEVTRQQAAADTIIILHMANNGSSSGLKGETIMAASDRVRAALVGGGLRLKAAKTSEALSSLDFHLSMGGSVPGSPQLFKHWGQQAIDDPTGFRRNMEQADGRAIRNNLSLGQWEALEKIYKTIALTEQKALVKAKEGVTVPDLKASLDIMGYDKKSTRYTRLLNNSAFVDSMNAFNLSFTKKHGRVPNTSELNSHAAGMLIDVHVTDPTADVSEFQKGLANITGNKAISLIEQPAGVSDRKDYYLDVSNDKPGSKKNDINRIARAYSMTPEKVRKTLEQLKDDGVNDPTIGEFEEAVAPPATAEELERSELEDTNNLPSGLLEFVTGGSAPLLLGGVPVSAAEAARLFTENPDHPSIKKWLKNFEERETN